MHRMIPLTELSMPRLKLLACILLSKLLGQVKSDSTSHFHCWIFLWEELWGSSILDQRKEKIGGLDLRIVLWKQGKYLAKKLFHVSGVFNPEDILTRVCSREYIMGWFDEPEILYSDKFEIIKFDASNGFRMFFF